MSFNDPCDDGGFSEALENHIWQCPDCRKIEAAVSLGTLQPDEGAAIQGICFDSRNEPPDPYDAWMRYRQLESEER